MMEKKKYRDNSTGFLPSQPIDLSVKMITIVIHSGAYITRHRDGVDMSHETNHTVLLTPEEAAARLRLSPSTLAKARLAAATDLPFVKIWVRGARAARAPRACPPSTVSRRRRPLIGPRALMRPAATRGLPDCVAGRPGRRRSPG